MREFLKVGPSLLIRGLAGDFLSLRRCAFPWSPREEIPPIAAHPHPEGQSSAQEEGVSARLRHSPLHKSNGMRGFPEGPAEESVDKRQAIRSGGALGTGHSALHIMSTAWLREIG